MPQVVWSFLPLYFAFITPFTASYKSMLPLLSQYYLLASEMVGVFKRLTFYSSKTPLQINKVSIKNRRGRQTDKVIRKLWVTSILSAAEWNMSISSNIPYAYFKMFTLKVIVNKPWLFTTFCYLFPYPHKYINLMHTVNDILWILKISDYLN